MGSSKMPGFDILEPHLDLHRNLFIEASAGTGKTFTIENTVLRLIQEGIPVEQILVVTFTRASTLELKTRIRRSLEAKHMRKELAAFEEARIFTIHGFCFHTLKEHALDTGFNLNQREESASLGTLKKIFKDFMRSELHVDEIHPKQLERILKAHRYDIDTLFDAILKPAQNNYKTFATVVEYILFEIKTLWLESTSLYDELILLAHAFSGMCDRQKKIKADMEEGIARFCALFDRFESKDLFDLPIIHMVPSNLLKNQGYPDLLHRMHSKLIPALATLADPEMGLNYLRGHFQRFLERVCLEEDLFFYDDLLTKMQRCVHQADIVAKMRAKYRAVLIDEFQDTDAVQWD